MKKENGVFYTHLYSPNSNPPVSNTLLVIGFDRNQFGFKFFYYFDLKTTKINRKELIK